MFQSKTVFILGAGASQEYHMPVGKELAPMVGSKVDMFWDPDGRLVKGDFDLFRAVRADLGIGSPALQLTGQKIVRGLPLRKSIDDFLDLHHSDTAMVRYGKAAIVKSIIERENSSGLAPAANIPGGSIEFRRFGETWLLKLMQMLGQRNPEKTFENIAFISFNYDRTLERFLLCALQDVYGLDDQTAVEIIKRVPIFHPYGTVGQLIALGGTSGFGVLVPDTTYVAMANSIRTYTEELSDNDEIQKMHEVLSEAATLVFLGFGFHEQNIKLLTPNLKFGLKRIYCTAKGIADADVQALRRIIGDMFSDSIRGTQINNENHLCVRNALTCSQLIEEYALTLPRI